MVALEDAFGTRIDENAFAEARGLPPSGRSSSRARVRRGGRAGRVSGVEPIVAARAIRRASLPTWILPIARLFAWIHVDGRETSSRSAAR